MLTNNRLRHASVEQLVAGELFVFSFGGVNRSLMMKLFTPPNRPPLFGVLESTGFKTPLAWYSGEVNGPCLSYGTSWFVETIPGPETQPSNTYEHDPAHRLFLDSDGSFVWRFQGEDGFAHRGTLHYAIGDERERSLHHSAAPFARFRVWAAHEDYLDARAAPIFSYPKASTRA